MKWFWVLILCSLSASLGLIMGCMCRVAGEADKRLDSEIIGGTITIGRRKERTDDTVS